MQLNEFADEERMLLISIPYRVGMWISDADDIKGSERDDKREEKTLEMAIDKLSKNHRKMPFASAVMQALEKNKKQWTMWKVRVSEEDVLNDLRGALEAVKKSASKRDLSEYKHAVWQIAMVVAQAYDEDQDPDNEMHVNNFFEFLGGFILKPKLKKRPDYISAREKVALKKLQAVLKTS